MFSINWLTVCSMNINKWWQMWITPSSQSWRSCLQTSCLVRPKTFLLCRHRKRAKIHICEVWMLNTIKHKQDVLPEFMCWETADEKTIWWWGPSSRAEFFSKVKPAFLLPYNHESCYCVTPCVLTDMFCHDEAVSPRQPQQSTFIHQCYTHTSIVDNSASRKQAESWRIYKRNNRRLY